MKNQVLIDKNQERWDNVSFYPHWKTKAQVIAKSLVDAKDVYLSISGKTGVPWYVIAVIHQRESAQRWDRSLAQGDRWNTVSTHVPKGRGPFNSFEDAAVDALKNCPPYAARWSDWSAGGTLTLLEMYNGLGYSYKGLPSPYIWSGTDQYVSGKYVADGVFDPNAIDQQMGCALLLNEMSAIDPTISFNGEEVDTPPIKPDVDEDENTAIKAPKAGPVGDTTDTKPASKSTEIITSVIGFITASGAAISHGIDKALSDWRILSILCVAAAFGFIAYRRWTKDDIKGLF